MFGGMNSIVLSEAEFKQIELNMVKAVELAQKVKAMEPKRTLEEMIPKEFLQKYRKVFEKEALERLLKHKQWIMSLNSIWMQNPNHARYTH